MIKRYFWRIASLIMIMVLTGCGGSTTGGSMLSGKYTTKYTLNDGARSQEIIETLEFNKDGTVKYIEGGFERVSEGTYQIDDDTLEMDLTWMQRQKRYSATIDGDNLILENVSPFYGRTFSKK